MAMGIYAGRMEERPRCLTVAEDVPERTGMVRKGIRKLFRKPDEFEGYSERFRDSEVSR